MPFRLFGSAIKATPARVKLQAQTQWTLTSKLNKNWTSGSKNFKPSDLEEKPSTKKTNEVCANTVSPLNTLDNKLSRAKLDELRAEGKCFNCK